MLPSTFLILLASTASAQSVMDILNPYEYRATLTQIAVDSTATTYKNDCPAGKTGVSALPPAAISQLNSASTVVTLAPSATPKALLARQNSVTRNSATSDDDEWNLCEPYTITQGASSWAMHLQDPLPGAWTWDANCHWTGSLGAADATCTLNQKGFMTAFWGDVSSTMEIIPQSSLKGADLVTQVTIVSGSASATASPSATVAAGSQSGSSSGSAVRSSGTVQSTGLAPATAIPTSAVALAGGVVGILAAALAL